MYVEWSKGWLNVQMNQLQMYLDSNVTAYSEYFEWKNYFKVSFDYNRVFCRMCEALNDPDPDPDSPRKVKRNISRWWRTQGRCRQKGSFPWSRSRPLNLFRKIVWHFFLFSKYLFCFVNCLTDLEIAYLRILWVWKSDSKVSKIKGFSDEDTNLFIF